MLEQMQLCNMCDIVGTLQKLYDYQVKKIYLRGKK